MDVDHQSIDESLVDGLGYSSEARQPGQGREDGAAVCATTGRVKHLSHLLVQLNSRTSAILSSSRHWILYYSSIHDVASSIVYPKSTINRSLRVELVPARDPAVQSYLLHRTTPLPATPTSPPRARQHLFFLSAPLPRL